MRKFAPLILILAAAGASVTLAPSAVAAPPSVSYHSVTPSSSRF